MRGSRLWNFRALLALRARLGEELRLVRLWVETGEGRGAWERAGGGGGGELEAGGLSAPVLWVSLPGTLPHGT